MTTSRQFARIRQDVPDGLCLCTFLVIRSSTHPFRVLMGKLDPSAPWDHLGALDADRVAAWKDRWMLPSCHLQIREGPSEAASRILQELTGLSPRALEGPLVASEVYQPERHPTSKQHWDVEFIFRGEAQEAEIRPHTAWTELRFVDTPALPAREMARSQGDILEHAGFPLRRP